MNLDELRSLGWKHTGVTLGSGGQAKAYEVVNEQGDIGVFRTVLRVNEKSKARFNRELKILTDPTFESPFLVKILQYSEDPNDLWYISKRGAPFEEFWLARREQLRLSPDQLAQESARIIAFLCSALGPLHKVGVVHRDIKPRNIVITEVESESVPALIDFGIAYHPEEERITDVDEATGNFRFSPDIMANRLEDVPPWLDVFGLAQLLIWMTQIEPSKTWARPLHWKYVNYPEGMSDLFVQGLRAITAQCSEPETCPSDAYELANLIQNQLPGLATQTNERPIISKKPIEEAIAMGTAEKTLRLANDRAAITASIEAASLFYSQMRKQLKSLFGEVSNQGIPVELSVDKEIRDFAGELVSEGRRIETTLLEYIFSQGATFNIRVVCFAFVPSRRHLISGPNLPDTSNMFVFHFQRYSNVRNFPHEHKLVTIERDGSLFLRNPDMQEMAKTEIDSIRSMIVDWIQDERPWLVISK